MAICPGSEQVRPRVLFIVLAIAMAFTMYATAVTASPYDVAEEIPHVSVKAKEGYLDYHYADGHKAYAIAPGGAWSWVSGLASPEIASVAALEACEKNTLQRCTIYALNDQVIFETDKWESLWGPYLSEQQALLLERGSRVGQRFVDLTWYDAEGAAHSVGDLRGKVVLVHFWGSWCPSCLRELPLLKRFQQSVESNHSDKAAIVLLQVRESFIDAYRWAKMNDLGDLPMYDSGAKTSDHKELMLTGKRKVEDRTLAQVFPTTYILDPNGVVLFKHSGAIHDWSQYLPFVTHVIQNHEGDI